MDQGGEGSDGHLAQASGRPESSQRRQTAIVALLGEFARDARFSLRTLRKQPGFVIAAILTLALGIGANVAMFSVINLALFRALPFADSDRLVLGRTLWPSGGIGWTVSAPDYYDVRDQSASFESLEAMTPFTRDFTVTGGGEPERISGAWISPGLFRALGVAPLLGRGFRDEEGEPGGERVVMLSHDFWQRRFGADRAVVGSTVTIEGAPQTVVGVMPAGFEFVVDVDAWAPMVRGEAFSTARQFHNWLLVGRLRAGVSLAEAQSEVDVIMGRLAEAYPESNRDKGLVLTEMQEAFAESFRSTLLMLTGAIALVLLIACGNVASLLLARGSSRQTELAMRSALGADGGRLVRQLLTESAVLGLAAGALGTVVALSLQRSLVATTPLTRMGLRAAGLQPEVLGFAFALSMATVLVFGLVPALSVGRVDPAEDLKAGARSVAASGRTRFRHGLVVGQVAVSVILLVGAGLLLRSFVHLRSVDPGFDSESVLTADIGLPRANYQADGDRLRFFSELQERVSALPGVLDVGLISRLPVRDPGGNIAAWDPANPPADASEWRLAYARMVMPGYFEAMGIPIVAGRDVQSSDAGGAPVMVISEAMARTIFPDQRALGRRVAIDTGDEPAQFEVVGVVGDVRVSSLSGDVSMVMYLPYSFMPQATMRLAVHTAVEPRSIVEPLRATLREMDPDIPLAGLATMDEVLSRSVSFQRTVMSALGLFAGVALFLAALGLYGVLTNYVAQRKREIGIRMAMGASGGDVLRLVLARGFALVGVGLALGIAGAIGAGRLISSMLFDIDATDPLTLSAIALFFIAVAMVACLIPAWRAWRIDPAVAFGSE